VTIEEVPEIIEDLVLEHASLLVNGTHTEQPTWVEIAAAMESNQLMWLDCTTPDQGDLQRMVKLFGIDEEMLSDSGDFNQRTRLSEYDSYVLLVAYGVAADARTMMEVHVYVMQHRVVTIRNGPCPPVEQLHDRADKMMTPTTTVPAVLSRILSVLVGTFSDALDTVDEELTELETSILYDDPSTSQIVKLLDLRKRVNTFRRAVDPARDLVGAGRFVIIDALADDSEDARRHLRDLAVDLAHVGDQVESERDRLAAVMDIYMNQVNYRQNDIMKKLATVSTVFLPLMFITGFFGMNFAFMVQTVNSSTAFLILGIGLNLMTMIGSLYVMKRRGWW
jgi:magnesium transporter